MEPYQVRPLRVRVNQGVMVTKKYSTSDGLVSYLGHAEMQAGYSAALSD